MERLPGTIAIPQHADREYSVDETLRGRHREMAPSIRRSSSRVPARVAWRDAQLRRRVGRRPQRRRQRAPQSRDERAARIEPFGDGARDIARGRP
jgi:hypothetical protein